MFVIGIDPHKGSHSAAVLDQDEQLVGELRVRAGRRQRDELVAFAARFEPRCWAIEGATGTGALLAQQLVAVGETVLDVPPTLSARARLLDAGRIDKTDAHDARSAAVVALRHSKLRTVVLEDHTAVLRLLAKRHHDLVAHRTRAICRLHAVLCHLVAGGAPTPAFRRLELRLSCAGSVRPTRSGSNVDDSPSSSSPRSVPRTVTSSRSRPASPARSTRRRRQSPT